MSGRATLVVELLTEELPPKALFRLGNEFAEGLAAELKNSGFLTDKSAVTAFATARRLAVSITHVQAKSPDQPFKQKLMPASVALDASGMPTVALKRKLESMGHGDLVDAWPRAIGPDRPLIEPDGKADAVFLQSIAAGKELVSGLMSALETAIVGLRIPKVMSYARRGSYYNDVKFVRPAHRLLALHGSDVVPVSVLGLEAGRMTSGHRFLARDDIEVNNADVYDDVLRAHGKVIANFSERRGAIVDGLQKKAAGETVVMPDGLVDEVTALVEWPEVYAGAFDPAFLSVPQECLILTMQQNQKYFALEDPHGKLVPRFLVVSNLAVNDPASIIEGNERVLRARLADARFFYDQDRKTPLADRVPKLATVVFHNKLGSQLARVSRLEALAGEIASMIGANRGEAVRAAHLAKADLTTDMVGEFPELQGLMGRYYAEYDGETANVSAAIEQHYWPRYAGDSLPGESVAQSVALADKLELLAGMFGIGTQPSGDKDPFGLRRAALGVIRILIEKRVPVTLAALVDKAFAAFGRVPDAQDARTTLESFVFERLRGYLRELGYTANQVASVADSWPAELYLVPERLSAVQAFEKLPEADALATANKRIVNILRKSGSEAAAGVDRARLSDGAEHDLYLAFEALAPTVANRCAAGDFSGALLALATVKPAVDRFFDDVLVMAEDPAIRANRLALLKSVAQTMNRVADISKLAA
jgi:glycyl-tRNA synthetase beta chain